MTTHSAQKTASSPSSKEKMGLRERGKLERKRRICAAARQAFTEKGYDSATTRDIAALAEVGIGTLFTYAKDKRELLMMILNDDLDRVSEEAENAADARLPLIDQLLAFFRPRYEYWETNPELGRPIVREIMDVAGATEKPGPETARFYERRPRMMHALENIIVRTQAEGKATCAVPAALVASLFLTIYLTEVRRWMHQEKPQAAEGMARLKELLALAIRGAG